VDQDELYAECVKYYANILTPFSPLVIKKINEVLSLKLPLDMICTSHGVIWRSNPAQIVEKYLKWADAYQENQVTLVYDTMWNGTRVMAESIAEGIREADRDASVKLFNASKTDKNDIITEVFKSKAVGVGSPTINQGILHSMAALLEEMRGLKFKNKKAFSFGCYGWSGESVKMINEGLKTAGFALIGDGMRTLWNPDTDAKKACVEFGRKMAESM
jgi:flavorubredoxin